MTFTLLILCPFDLSAKTMPQEKSIAQINRILFVTSNVSTMGPDKIEVGNYQVEVAPPYKVFVDAGFIVDFVSPKGGEIPLYGRTTELTESTKKTADFDFDRRNSLKPQNVKVIDYAGVFYVGGYGIPFDISANTEIANITSKIYQRGGVVGGSGHGPIGLSLVQLENGRRLISGKRITGFPNLAEKRNPFANYGKLLPLTVEDSINNSGGKFQGKGQNSSDDVVSDQRLVTTMFAPAAVDVASTMVSLLKEAKEQ